MRQGFKEEALAVATDPEHQFELAVQLGKLQTAYAITQEQPSEVKSHTRQPGIRTAELPSPLPGALEAAR